MYNSLLLLSREQFFSFPPAALAGIPVSDAAKVTPELCGCGPPDGEAAPPVDFGSVAQMLSTLPRGLGGRHPNGLPWYTVDGHTRRGSGMDTTGLFHSAAQRWGLAGEIEDWPAAEVLVSRTSNRSCTQPPTALNRFFGPMRPLLCREEGVASDSSLNLIKL